MNYSHAVIRTAVVVLMMLLFSKSDAQLKADFNAVSTSGCAPLIVSFKDQSIGSPTYWKWDLGNGTISYLQNPTATYFAPGTYNVKLIIKKGLQADSVIKSQFVTVHQSPLVDFSATNIIGCYPLTVNFNDATIPGSGISTSWQWDFGDGTTSTQQHPSHTYTSTGAFTVSLKSTNSFGCSKIISKPAFINITTGVKANFTSSVAATCLPPTPVSFTNTSVGSGSISYLWNFGDGSISTQQSPTHTYNTIGSYTVTLIATNSYGCSDTIIKTNAVNIGSVAANFNVSDTICAGASTTFTNTSSPATVSATWNFGDGTTSTDINPSKVFATAGKYQVKLISNFGACADTIIKEVTVKPKPSFTFTNNISAACNIPLNVQFNANATDAVLYEWSFGDGGTSTNQNPTHTYNSFGNCTVSVRATNAEGCSNELKKDALIKINPVSINKINGVKVQGCIPYTITPTPDITSPETIASYHWDFGDGTTSASINPTHTYNAAGSFAVTLIITTINGCKDTLIVNDAVRVGVKTNPDFTVDRNELCVSDKVNFTDTATGQVHAWFWIFGDGGFGETHNPSHQYGDTGWLNVSLITVNYGCFDTVVKKKYIHVNPPIARFNPVFNCDNKLSVSFKDSSVAPMSWEWSFGDNTTSIDQNPVHVYSSVGKYVVKVKVTNGNCSHTNYDTIIIVDEKGSFTVNDTIACRNTNVSFAVNGVNAENINAYTWNFGDAAATTSYSPVAHAYTANGSYSSSVIVTDVKGCKDTLIAPVTTSVYGPLAMFTLPVAGSCVSTNVSFTDKSTADPLHPIRQWQWSYGDGSTGSSANHGYTTAGIYNISLKVVDDLGCTDSSMLINALTIADPVASFAVDSLICPKTNISFSNLSHGEALKYSWSLGDGSNASVFTPTHAYLNQGTFDIKLSVEDKFGCKDTVVQQINVFIPKASFSLNDSFATCPPLQAAFANTSSHYTSYSWSFGNGNTSSLPQPSHLYTEAGVFQAKLIVTNVGGCSDSVTKPIKILGPKGKLIYQPISGCSPVTVNLTSNAENTATYIWDLNDGNTITNNSSTLTHVYDIPGIYLPKLILMDASGCKVPIEGKDTINVNGIKTHILASTNLLCDKGEVRFSDSTIANDIITSYFWKFGDGGTSTERSPTHHFSSTGNYNVSVVLTSDQGCIDSATIENEIAVIKSPQASIIGDTAACVPARLKFSATAIDTSSVNWMWSFGNGETSEIQNPPTQLYNKEGNYRVTVIGRNSSGCTDTVYTTAIAHPLPKTFAGVDTIICRSNTYQLKATGAAQYQWEPHPSLNCTCNSPIIKPDSTSTYIVTGISSFGCVQADTITVTVRQPLTMSVSNNDTLCLGEQVQLKAFGADNYQWYPSQYLSNASSASPKFTPTKDTTITYRVIGKDTDNCFSDTGYVTAKVYPQPSFSIEQDQLTVSGGTNTVIKTKRSADITKIRWTPSMWLDDATKAEPTSTPRENITYKATATNNGGCSSTDEVTVTVTCNGANVFVPNTFSPNADGMNDVFYPRGKGLFRIKSFQVFNRWGQLVFTKTDVMPNEIQHGWDGNVNGKPAQADVFVYLMEVLCDNNTTIPLKGDITLLR